MLCGFKRCRRAMTLLELLVVLGIMVILIGVLVPAVQKVRRAALRTQCQNNLKQIALAFHLHHDSLGAFPHGGYSGPGCSDASPTNRKEWSWCYQILPYLGENNLYRESSYAAIDSTPLSVYYCPARRRPMTYHGLAKVDYAGSAGTDPFNGSNGILVRGPVARISFASITKGASNTVLLSEKQLNTAMLGISCDDDASCYRAGWSGDYEVYRVGNVQPAPDIHKPGVKAGSPRFGSAHDSCFNAAFADGSASPIRYNIKLSLWANACVRDGSGDNDNDRHFRPHRRCRYPCFTWSYDDREP